MSEYFQKLKSLWAVVKVELDLSNYATKANLKNTTGVDTSDFAIKTDLADLESDADKLDIDKLKNVPINLSNLKSKADKLNADELVLVPFDLRKLSYVVKNDFVKKDVYNANIKDIEDRIFDITNWATRNDLPSITNLAKTAALNPKINEVENKIPNITNLVITNALTTVENKIPYPSKYISIPEFNKLTAENFAARLAQANLASKNYIANFVKKTDFDDKPKNLNKKIISNKENMYLLKVN